MQKSAEANDAHISLKSSYKDDIDDFFDSAMQDLSKLSKSKVSSPP